MKSSLQIFREFLSIKMTITNYFGVSAQHKRSQTERAIKTIIYMDLTLMVDFFLHWSEHGVDIFLLWLIAINHKEWL